MLPHAWIPWLAKQPDSVLNAKGAQIDILEGETTSLCENVLRSAAHEDVVRREFKLHLNTLIPEMMDEIQNAANELFGSENDDFREINLDEMIREIVTKAANRVLVGLPLCQFNWSPLRQNRNTDEKLKAAILPLSNTQGSM